MVLEPAAGVTVTPTQYKPVVSIADLKFAIYYTSLRWLDAIRRT